MGDVKNNTVLTVLSSVRPLLQKGGILGLQVTNDRQLCFYVNGKRVGVAATDIPNTIYGFVDLYYSGCEAVKLIPDVHEVRYQNYPVNHFYMPIFPVAYM